MSSPFRFWLTILVITGFGLFLRLQYAAEPLWLDELHTAWSVDAPLSQVANRAGQGNQTPLYFWLTAVVTAAIDLNPLSLRFVPLLCGSVATIVAARFVYRVANNLAAATATAILIATDTWLIFYASEARPYSMLQLIALLQFITLFSILSNEEKQQRLLNWKIALLSFLLLATHLTGGILIAVEAILICLFRPKAAKPLLFSLVAGCLAAAPMLMASTSIIEYRGQWSLASGTTQLVNDWQTPLLFQLVPAAVILIACWNRTEDKIGLRTAVVISALWATTPLLFSVALNFCSIPVASYRYTTVASLAPPICLGLALAMIPTRWISAACISVVVVANLTLNPITHSLINDMTWPRLRSEDWKSVTQFVNNIEGNPGKLVFLFANIYEDERSLSDASEAFQSYLTFPISGIYKLNPDATVVPMPTLVVDPWSEIMLRKIVRNGGATLICRVETLRLNQIQNELRVALGNIEIASEFETFNQPGNNVRVVKVVALARQN